MPITAVTQIPKMIKLSNAFIPRKLLAICDRFGDSPEALRQAGIAYATDQIIDLISNGIRGVHIYTMNKPEIAQAIMENVNDIIGAWKNSAPFPLGSSALGIQRSSCAQCHT